MDPAANTEAAAVEGSISPVSGANQVVAVAAASTTTTVVDSAVVPASSSQATPNALGASQPAASSANPGAAIVTNNLATPTAAPTATPPDSSAGSAAAGTAGPSGSGGVENARFVQRVAKAFQTAGDQGGSLRLRLSPPELGSLKLDVTVSGGVLNARVEAETVQARDMLLGNLPALRERLAEHNVKIAQFDVDLSDSSTGGSPGQPQSNSDPQQAYAPAPSRAAPGAAAQPLGLATSWRRPWPLPPGAMEV